MWLTSRNTDRSARDSRGRGREGGGGAAEEAEPGRREDGRAEAEAAACRGEEEGRAEAAEGAGTHTAEGFAAAGAALLRGGRGRREGEAEEERPGERAEVETEPAGLMEALKGVALRWSR